MRPSVALKSLKSGCTLEPPATFPPQPPPQVLRPEDIDLSVVSEDYHAVSIQGWGSRQSPDPFIDDPISFELDDKPFTINPTNRAALKKKDQEQEEDPRLPDEGPHIKLSQGSRTPRKGSWVQVPPAIGDTENQLSSVRNTIEISEATPPKKKKQIGDCGSFLFGLLLGLNPLFIIARVCVRHVRKGQGRFEWQDQWVKNGQTVGLFILVIMAIILIVININ